MEGQYKSHKYFYIAMFFLTVALTLLQVLVVKLPLLNEVIVALLVVIALVKVYIEGYHLMHLKHEPRWLQFIAATPLFAVAYAVVVVVESLAR